MFYHGRGTLDQLYNLLGSWRKHGNLPNQSTCFVDLEKAFDRVPQGVLWEVLQEYGVLGPLLQAVQSLFKQSESLVRFPSCKWDSFSVRVGLSQG